MSFAFDRLRRRPDIEAPDLPAFDAADRLLLDESADARGAVGSGEVVVIGDAYGALALASATSRSLSERSETKRAPAPFRSLSERSETKRPTLIRVHQDALTGERALALNAADLGLTGATVSLPLDAELVRGARVVLLRLPRSLDALADIAGLIAAHASPDVVVFAGGRIKHMSVAMNDVLRASFGRLDVTHARQKSRVLIAREPRAGRDPEPQSARIDGLEIRAFGGAFAGAKLDIGTRMLLAHLPADLPGGTADDPFIDFACGTGVIAATLAMRHPSARVYASDQSAAAVASAMATVTANGVAERVRVVRDDLLCAVPDGSASFIALNPPFHSGAAVTDLLAPRLFADAARVLRPDGQLWCVWNSSLRYRPALERLVGPTEQIARDPKFTVTVSTRRSGG